MKSIQPQAVSTGRKGRAQGILLLALFAGVGFLVFHALWAPGAVLLSSDDNVGLLRANQRMLEASAVHPWMGETLWGLPTMSMVRPGYFLLKAVRAEWFMNTFHATCLALSAWLLALYLKDKGLRVAACAFGGLVAFWVGTNLTLTYAGHVGKYGLMVFLSLSVFALGRWGKTGRMAWSVVAGAAAGAMFLEQADVAFFCALLLAPLGLFEASRAAGGWKAAAIAKQSWAAALAAVLLAGGASLAAKGSGVTESTDAQSPADRWAYLTQWSQPPGESLDFIAPGWMGWRSGDPEGPYWGQVGRDEARGNMNIRGETVYVGAIPLLFAVLGLAAAFRRRREEDSGSAAVFAWGGLCAVALLLAFGKFLPLYKPLSLLPGFGSIRNPNKFIHFFQMAWGVLAAFGLDAAMKMESRAAKKWLWGSGIVAGIFLLSGLALWTDLGAAGVARMANWWGDQMGMPPEARMNPQYWEILVNLAQPTLWNKAFSVTYAGGALLVGAGILWMLSRQVFHGAEKSFPQRGKMFSTAWKTGGRQLNSWGAWIPALLVAFDAAVILAPHYLQTMPPGFVAENELARYLKGEIGSHRTAMATQDGFYNNWLTYLFPYQGIPSVNVTQLPRPPADYTAFWNAMEEKVDIRDPRYWQRVADSKVRLWQLTAVSHVLAHGPVASAILENPVAAAQLEKVWAYQPMDDGRGGVATRRVPLDATAPEVVLKMKKIPPRVAAATSWRVAEDAAALQAMADPAFEPFSSVLLAPGSVVAAPPPGDPGPPAEIEIARLIPGRCEFTVKNPGPVVVRVAEKFDPGWKATVDGKSVPVLRVDYMFQGVALEEAGTHEVALWYSPPRLPVLLQGAGLLAGLGAAGVLAVPRRRKEPAA